MLPNEKLKSSMSKIKVTRIFDAPKMLFSGILILALTAALVAVIPDSTKPVFADLSGLPSDTGFPCSADEGRGGIPYQFMWGTKSKSLLDKSIADAVRGGGDDGGTSGIQWQVGGYNPSTEEYDVVGTWSPEVDGGLKDDNGSVLIAENTFAKKEDLEQVNGFVMDPFGNGYVAIQPSGGANTYYVQLIPDTDADGLGEMRAIAKLQDVDDINGGTYYEDSNGDPYAILSSNFLGKSFLVPLTRANNANIPDISYVDYDGDSNPKDYSWVKEEITYNGNQYNLVGLEQTSSTKGTIWLQHTEDKNRASISNITLPSNSNGSGETFGASYNFKFENEKTFLYFSANKKGELVRIELPDPDGNGDIIVTGASSFTAEGLGGTTKTTNNDGAGCPYELPPVAGDLSALTWPPDCVTDNATGEGSTVPIKIFNNSSGAQIVKVTATIDGVTVPSSDYRSTPNTGSLPDLNNATFSVSGKASGSGVLELSIDINKDEVWSATVTTSSGEQLVLSPSGGTLNADSCDDDFPGADVFSPNITLGACSLGNDGSFAIPATIDNSLSTSDANITIKVDGSIIETLVVSAESTENISIAPVQSGESVEVLAVDAMGVAATVTVTANASCPSSVDAYDCSTQSGFIQTRLNETQDGYDTVLLDTSTNSFNQIWTFKKTVTGIGDDEFTWLNGTAIHPTSGQAYGIMVFNNDDGTNNGNKQRYLVRFDSDTVEYVFTLDRVSSNGAFDNDGNFYWHQHSTTDNQYPHTVWKIDNPDSATGYSDRQDPAIPAAGTSIGGAIDTHFKGRAGDITHLEADLGNGVSDYVLGLGGGTLSITDLNTAIPYEFPNLAFADGSAIGSTAYGAAYTINDQAGNGKVYFSSNDGGFILNLDLSSINLNDESQTVAFFNAGNVPISDVNDGMNCATTVRTLPEEFGDVFGYVWVDFNDDGLRTSIEDGDEPHVTGYSVTFRNANEYKDSSGDIVHQPGGMEYSGVLAGTDTGDYRWEANLPCKDNSGTSIEWTSTFDYTGVSNWPTGFTPNGYTTETNESVITSEVDSDGAQSGSEILVANSFTVTCGVSIQSSIHRADAGVIGDFNFAPTVSIDISCATAVTIDLDNSSSDIDSTFIVNVYRLDSTGLEALQPGESASQVVVAGATDQYSTAITLPPSDVILFLKIEGQGTLNGATNPDRYSQDVLNQSANDGVNFLCVQVQAEMDCASGGEQVALNNTASNQDATFIVTPVVDGVDQAPITQVVASGATVVLTNTELAIPEDSTWTIKWEATGATAGSFDQTSLGEELEKDCVAPVFDPVVTYSFACASDGSVQMTFAVDNTASTQFDTNVEPVVDRYAAHVSLAIFGLDVTGSTIKVAPGTVGQGTVTIQQSLWVEIWVQQTRPWDPTAEGINGGMFLEEIQIVTVGSCPEWNPVITLAFECGVRGTGLLTTNINNAASDVDMRYKLVATDFAGNDTVVNDWETVPAGQDRIVTLSQIVDQNLEYSIVAESTEAHPASFNNGAVTSPAGWGSLTEAEYADCVVDDTWSPFAEITAECASGFEEIFLTLDNSRSTFGAEFTVDVFDGPSYDSPKNEAASSTQSIPAGSLELYSTAIPLPSPGDAISLRVTVIPITTGGESLSETSEISLTQVINCPENLVFDISIGLVCGTAVQGLIINNELSSQSITIEATQYLSPDSSDGPWKLGEVYSDATSEQTVEIPEGEERQFIFYAINKYYWKIEWVLTQIDGEPTADAEIDITTEGTLKSAGKLESQSDDSCPDTPLFTG
tara:strand:+ start:3429 stop:8732 length:5304 start_codon:yes stop_codon:yes gene_type:complete